MSITGSTAPAALSRLGGLLPVEPSRLSDLQLVALLEHAESAARQVAAVQLAAASEMARRSDAGAPDSLAKRLGYKTPAQALEAITKSTSAEARKLVADAAAIAKRPTVEAAVLAGRIGRDAGAAIAGELTKAAAATQLDATGGVDTTQLAAAEEHLVELATTTATDRVRARAQQIAAELTPEMIQAQADRAMAERFFWISPTRNGAARLSGLLPAGHAAAIRSVIDAYANPRGKKTVGFVDAETGRPNMLTWGDNQTPGDTLTRGGTLAPADTRTAGQKRADLLRDICAAQARTADTPDMGGDHPTVWITTTAAELQAGEGLAHYAGAEEPVTVHDAVQAACTGGTQLVVFGDDGRLLSLGREVRGFTRRQRRAIAARDGGTCLIPGCATPAQWCEVHHVLAYSDGGHTNADNGVNLCWFHHREIDSGPWQVRMRHGTPEIRYAFGGDVRDWAPAGNGAAAKIRARTATPPAVQPPPC